MELRPLGKNNYPGWGWTLIEDFEIHGALIAFRVVSGAVQVFMTNEEQQDCVKECDWDGVNNMPIEKVAAIAILIAEDPCFECR